jgi:hypothetical protein
MSLTYSETNIPLARIVDEKTLTSEILYLLPKDEDDDSKEDILQLAADAVEQGIPEEEIIEILSLMNQNPPTKEIRVGRGKTCIIMPSPKSERVFMAAPPEAGKSVVAARYIIEYMKMWPENPVFVFAASNYDKAYDGIDLEWFKVTQEIYEMDLSCETMGDCLIVMDDLDSLTDSKLSKYIHAALADLANNGRKEGVYLMYLSHHINNYAKTRDIAMAANKAIFFPLGPKGGMVRFLDAKVGIDKQAIKKMLNLESRYFCLTTNTYPNTVVHSKGIFIL